MSSGFVSGGTADAPIERSDEWLKAQQEIEANRARKAELARQQDGKSLFETLEANKAAKQEAFEEANRLKNQFRALDEDEIEFLDSVLESTRAEENRVKKETAEGLALFRQQQEEADKRARRGGDVPEVEAGSPVGEEETWVTGGRKRKRTKEKEVLRGVKIRRSSTANDEKDTKTTKPAPVVTPLPTNNKPDPLKSKNTKSATGTPDSKLVSAEEKKSPVPAKTASALVNYGSDEDDDW
ncbi:N-terminal domain of NEFA-interacting nuclear protein NIP30-domain-containing protein [Tricladium varicosporioides]|nr:N-terminal domain of NEFA-interacting nuclear protein NIP30-domain-containing protein [Hymenoscyphus varicosporioides]